MKNFFLLAALSFGLTSTAFGQLQWSSYNNVGALVTANVASGGDATYGGTVTFTVPATTQRIFVTKNFATINLTNASASRKVYFTMNASAGVTGAGSARAFGMGLFNDPGTPANALDDKGYWTDFNTKFEMFDQLGTGSTFFQFTSTLGTGSGGSGLPTDGNTYGVQFQLNVNNTATGISMGTSSSTYAAAGSAMTNITGTLGAVLATSYINPVTFSTLAVSNFNEFAFSFNNATANPITVTLGAVSLVPANPVITTQPLAFGGSPGSTATFTTVINTNAAPLLAYQWYQIIGGATNALANGATGNGSTISGATTNILSFSNAQAADNSSVFVVVTNTFGAVTSSVVQMLVSAVPVAPVINFVNPTNATIIATTGTTNIFISAVAVPSPTYYWFDNTSTLIQSGPTPTLALANVQLGNAGTYSVIASNQVSTATTNFTINVIVTPTISSPPTNLLLNVGDPANFSVTSSGVPTPTYQWLKNGVPIGGATATNYSIGSVALTDIANYSVVISNAAGVITSPNAKLAINSTMVGTPSVPANNASGICVDAWFKISFNQTPSIGNVGKIKIFDTANPGTPVDTIDMSLNNNLNVQARSLFSGDSQIFNYYPIIITGSAATIYPHSGVLTTGKTYYVTMEPGVIVDSSAAYFTGISSSTTWQFSTKSTGPVDPVNPVVAADGSEDFVTVQGAIDSLATNGPVRRVINIRNGTYTEIVDVTKTNITFRGQTRAGAVVMYPNNNNLTGTTHGRMTFKVNARDIAIENMTVTNNTPQGGSQAEALMVESGAGHFILNNAEVDSRQDTILANINTSQGYFYNSLVQGNFDYIWGGGNLFFTNCEIRTITGVTTPNLVAPRTDNGATGNWPGFSSLLVSNGFSFVNCRLTSANGATNCSMAANNGTLNGQAAFINCSIDTTCFTNELPQAPTAYLMWEYACSNLNNTVLLDNAHSPFINFTQLTGVDARLLAAQSVTNWLNNWTPALAPNIITNPASNATVSQGQTTNFTVSATGIPDPTYQWQHAGTNVPGGTSATLTIANAIRGNAGSYAVIASNGSGSVTSSVATLIYTGDVPPVANASTNSRPAGYALKIPIAGGLATNWTDADGDALVLTGAISSTNGATVSYDSSYVYYSNPNDVADQINYTITDGLSAPVAGVINIVVNSGTTVSGPQPITVTGSTATVTFAGIPTFQYEIQRSTNLVLWVTLFTTNAPGGGVFSFTDNFSDLGGVPAAAYYRTANP